MPISLCMIVKDEEKFLENCLNNIKNFVDEIIIVDTGSRDRTKEIAKKFTCKVYDFKWDDDFSEARNFSIKKATKEWILVLDADESISDKDLKKIEELIKCDNDKKVMGYSFIQRTYSNKQTGLKWNYSKNDNYKESKKFPGWNYRRITRLFRNDKKIMFIYPVHETVIEPIKEIKGRINPTGIPIHHFKFLKWDDFNKKLSGYYVRLLKNKVKLHPKAKFYLELAVELENSGKHKEAKKYLNEAITLNPDYKKFSLR
jgi:glycosyltransferase involved in cell wall biosynthesis